jgi:DNA-binding response OmpR family regulator
MHVLLIEPDAILSRTYAAALKASGHTVVTTTSAQAAVHLADEQVPDVVVLELQLGRHNGVEFLYEFRSYSEWLHIPIIVQTVVPPAELALAATLRRELGVVEILYKPTTSLERLRAVVSRSVPIAI